MAPSAISSAPASELGACVSAVSKGLRVKQENNKSGQQKHPSGDPALAFMLDEGVRAPKFEDPYEERAYLKQRLAIAFRIFARHGFTEAVAGHITLRDPVDPTTFWVNPFGTHFSFLEARDLIRLDEEGHVVEAHGPNQRVNLAAVAIHAEIHKARPDVLCAAHAHSLYGRAMCATGRSLDMITQDSCIFYKDHVVYSNFAGVVVANDEGRRIAECLGPRKAALLGNHGLLAVGPTIEATVSWFVQLESCCQIQLAADAAAGGRGVPLVEIGDDEARSTWEANGQADAGYFMALPLFQVCEREFGQKTSMGRGIKTVE